MADIVSTDLPIPNTTGDNTSPEVPVLIDGITVNDVLQKAWRATHKWFFASETVPIIKSIPIAKRKGCDTLIQQGLSVTRNGDEVSIRFLDEYIQEIQAKSGAESGEIIPGEIYRIVFSILNPRFEDDSYPLEFCQGFSNFVLVKEGIPLAPYCGRTTAHVWYGRKMPYFLDWMDKQFGDGTISKLTAALGAPYNKAVFETVTGTSISDLWKMYCVSQGEEGSENAGLNAELSELWPMPIVRHDFDRTCEQEWNDIFSNNLEPTGALNKALLAVFKHLYTPKTVPRSVIDEFCLVLRSGPMELPMVHEAKGSCCELAFSWDSIKSEKPTAKMVLELLVVYMIELYRPMDFNGFKPECNSWPSNMWDTRVMTAFVLVKEGIIPPRIPGERRSENNGLESPSLIDLEYVDLADFLCWIETTVGEGTVKKFYKRLRREKYDPSWLEELTGKGLKVLSNEYADTFRKNRVPGAILFLANFT